MDTLLVFFKKAPTRKLLYAGCLCLFIIVHVPSDFAWAAEKASIRLDSTVLGQDSLSSAKARQTDLATDTSTLHIRSFSPEKLDAYKKDQAFDYAEEIVPITWWQKLKYWFYDLLKKTFANRGSAIAIKWLLILVGAAALIFLVYKLSGMQVMGLFRKKSSAELVVSPLAENIHAIDFEEQVQQAIFQQNFRLAVRLLYLKSLKNLTDKHLIDWQPGKTNQTYITEISPISIKKAFITLTHQFEYVWYGDFQIQSQHFNQIRETFASFNKDLH